MNVLEQFLGFDTICHVICVQDQVSITRDWPGTVPVTIYDRRGQLLIESGRAKVVNGRGKTIRIGRTCWPALLIMSA